MSGFFSYFNVLVLREIIIFLYVEIWDKKLMFVLIFFWRWVGRPWLKNRILLIIKAIVAPFIVSWRILCHGFSLNFLESLRNLGYVFKRFDLNSAVFNFMQVFNGSYDILHQFRGMWWADVFWVLKTISVRSLLILRWSELRSERIKRSLNDMELINLIVSCCNFFLYLSYSTLV